MKMKDQDKIRIQHDNHVLIFITLVGSCTAKKCKTGAAFYSYVQRNLENIITVADVSYTGPTITLE